MSNPEAIQKNTGVSTETYSLFKVYAYYRFFLALLLLLMFYTDLASNVLGREHSQIFGITIIAYVLIAMLSVVGILAGRQHSSTQQIFFIFFVDITCITLLMYSSSGISSGLGLLLFVTISASSIILSAQIATLTAALATIAVISESIYRLLTTDQKTETLVIAGLLGLLLFVTSQIFLYMARRMRLTTIEAETQTEKRLQAQQLNELIVQRMLTGIVVLAPNGSIRLINESAAKLLEIPLVSENDESGAMSFIDRPELFSCFEQWRRSPQERISPIMLREAGPELQLSFAGLEQNESSDIIVFVEDTRKVSQQAQQLKLASLGHLTASIAHEVRNPLGAISHAAQLLAESPEISAADNRMTEIIQTHSRRVNQIIENVLQLSRRKNPDPKKIDLKDFLNKFVSNYRQAHREEIHIDLTFSDTSLEVNVDPSQLEQVLSNLCDNGLRYSKEATGKASLELFAYVDDSLGTPCLDIIDDGVGIDKDQEDKIFEPFFTTHTEGTGLGLYLARELCEVNQARLEYNTHRKRQGLLSDQFCPP